MVAIQALAVAFVVVVFILSVTSFFRGGESGLQHPSPGSANLLGSLVDIHAHRKPLPPCLAHNLGGTHHSTWLFQRWWWWCGSGAVVPAVVVVAASALHQGAAPLSYLICACVIDSQQTHRRD
jgi:hypothetical protein